MAILDAILSGERDPIKLAALCNWRVRSPRETVAKCLEGDYRTEHLFALKQLPRGWDSVLTERLVKLAAARCFIPARAYRRTSVELKCASGPCSGADRSVPEEL